MISSLERTKDTLKKENEKLRGQIRPESSLGQGGPVIPRFTLNTGANVQRE